MAMVAKQRTLATTMNAKLVGSGPETVVLAYGFGAEQAEWDQVVAFLVQRKYKVVLFDWAFSGAVKMGADGFYDPVKYASYDGYVTDLVGLLDEMKVSSSVFVGHSMAGMIGCLASINRPDLFHKLILVEASPRYLNTEDYNGGFDVSAVEQLIADMESNYVDWTVSFAQLTVGTGHPDIVDGFSRSLQEMRPEVALSTVKTVLYSDYRDILNKLSVVPCGIIQALNDAVVPNSVGLYMQQRINSVCTLDTMDVTGHFPQLIAPHQFIDLLAGLLHASPLHGHGRV